MKFAELHCKTNYSFLVGASHPDEYVDQAIQLGYSALAITDQNSLAGVVRAYTASRETDLKLIIGAEITPQNTAPIVLWATDRKAYGQLSRLITQGRRRAPKGECALTFADVANHYRGLICGVIPHKIFHDPSAAFTAPSRKPPPRASSEPNPETFQADAARYRDLFGQDCYLLAELHCGPDDRKELNALIDHSQQLDLPLVAGGNVHYHTPERMPLHDVLTAIRHGTTVSQAGHLLNANAQRHLQSIEQRRSIYELIPAAMDRTMEIADRCSFQLDELRYEYPEELAPEGLKPIEFLRQLSWEGAQKRYPGGIPQKVETLVKHELTLIEELHYEAYFLTVWDLVRFARSRGILCQGRGSAANSAVCYCLGVTSVDPGTTDVLFERFVSRQRNEAPDIDVDFEHERREEVLQYLYQKYGRDRAGLAATVITYRRRSAVRDVGKALGLSLDRVDALAKNIEGYHKETNFESRVQDAGIDAHSRVGRQLIHLVDEIMGFPRHLSQHVGGMVMTQGSLCELVPIENAAMPERTVIQWDKNDLEELGILKVDCLCLGMLSAIRKCFDMIERHDGRAYNLASIPPGDQQVYDMICRADTIGVFQIESRAQMSMLPRLKPRCYYDLVIEVAIVRPGPIQGDMVHPYLRRRNGEEPVEYPNDEIRQVLEKTLGIPLFQEQAMRLAIVAAGFTPGEADQLRRAMGAWRRPGVIDKFRKKLLAGMKSRGLSEKFAEQVFNQIRGFGEYGFPESHAASFALLVYVSCWLKHHYPAAFTASLLNSQPMGFYAPAQLVASAKEHGVSVLPVDVNHSFWDCTLEAPSSPANPHDTETPATSSPSIHPQSLQLRLGLRMISGLPQTVADALVQARQEHGPFSSLSEFTRRTRQSRAMIARLSEADAFASLQRDRRNALWEALSQEKHRHEQPLFGSLAADDEPLVELPVMQMQDEVYADYRTIGLSLKAHPISFCRIKLDELKVLPAEALKEHPNNRHVRVAGIVLLRQRPSTAKGITFVTLEDETGSMNLVIKMPVWERYYKIARRSQAWIAHGKLERKGLVIHVIVNRIEDMSHQITQLETKSRDFR